MCIGNILHKHRTTLARSHRVILIMEFRSRSGRFRTLIVLAVCVTSCSAAICQSPSTCDVDLPCDCCQREECHLGSDLCSTEFCKNGYWGGKCVLFCPKECECCDRNFGITNTCAVCVAGHYGTDCSSNCSEGCKSCEKTTGSCMECNHGYYGDKACNMSCSANCENGSCDKNTGACYSCKDGFYGTFCNQSCPPNCTDGICDKVNGQCKSCNTGYFGPFCYDLCPDNCFSNLCDKVHGNCFAGCSDGYHGFKCNISCPGFCKNSICSMYYGNCTRGCVPNFEGTYCERCVTGKYGAVCAQTCSENCLLEGCPNNCLQHGDTLHICLRENGTCKFGCESGFYGKQCDKICPVFCNVTCHRETRQCDRGCVINHFGSYCENKCSVGCAQGQPGTSRCHATNGTCIFGCLDSYVGHTCTSSVTGPDDDFPTVQVVVPVLLVIVAVVSVITALVVVRKRRLCQKASNPDSTYDNLQTELRSTDALYERAGFRKSPEEYNPVYVNTQLR